MTYHPAHFAYIILSPLLSTTFAVFNAITIYIFIRKFRLATLSLIVIINICACDIFVCMFSNTFYVANLLHPTSAWSTGAASCKMFKFLTMLTNVAQIYFLCILNADRLRRLLDNASKQWKKQHGFLFVGIAWMFAAIICLPRLVLFDESRVVKSAPVINDTVMVSYSCKPVGMGKTSFAVVTITTFVSAYALPLCFILYTLVRSQLFMWQRRKRIHFSTPANIVIKMNNTLALTFNLTGALFLIVWTPFFVLSLMDLRQGLAGSWDTISVNFSLRCTLLILGSAKPCIYFICLEKFRNGFKFKSPSIQTESSSAATNSCKHTKVSSPSGQILRVLSHSNA